MMEFSVPGMQEVARRHQEIVKKLLEGAQRSLTAEGRLWFRGDDWVDDVHDSVGEEFADDEEGSSPL